MILMILVYSLMRECWQWEAGRRPTFREMKYDMENMFQVIIIIMMRDDMESILEVMMMMTD